MKLAPETDDPWKKAEIELSKKLGQVCDGFDTFVILAALETMTVATLCACAPSLNEAVSQSRKTHDSIFNRLLAEEQRVGIPARETHKIQDRRVM